MEWTKEMALQLIDEYERFPVLWEAKHPSYFSRNKKVDAWEQIASNAKMDAYAAKQKMTSLLASFRREKAKCKKSVGTGKGMYFVFPILMFCIYIL